MARVLFTDTFLKDIENLVEKINDEKVIEDVLNELQSINEKVNSLESIEESFILNLPNFYLELENKGYVFQYDEILLIGRLLKEDLLQFLGIIHIEELKQKYSV